ncbi:MAG: hypothetical protein MUC38_00130 [Cyclobacteriaceae bacterium]|jgi:hypothetical protein|nr:hypothetical protein [Cyclobacteriaceae bacterium]
MKTQFVTDDHGKKLAVILPIHEYEKIMEDLEDMEEVRLYDEVKKNDIGERIPMEEAFKMIEAKRRK